MCSIFTLLNVKYDAIIEQTNFTKNFIKDKKEYYSKIEHGYLKMTIGCYTKKKYLVQPIVFKDIVLICDGEIYNYKEIYNNMKIKPFTDFSFEVIIYLYLKYGIEQTLNVLDGVYSFILYDNRINNECINNVYIARDYVGLRPLYKFKNTKESSYGFASQLSCLNYFCKDYDFNIEQFNPGTYSMFQYGNKVNSVWEPIITNKPYFILNFSYPIFLKNFQEKEIFNNILAYLKLSVFNRCKYVKHKSVVCLLDGQIESSIIAALVSKYFNTQIETFSIGIKNSENIKCAKIVSDYICSKHTEIIIKKKEIFDSIPEVIQSVENYDIKIIRESIYDYLVGKFISENSKSNVIFNVNGYNELFGEHLSISDDIEFDKEIKTMLENIHLRSEKTMLSNGLKTHTPFLDKTFVSYILNIPSYYRNHLKSEKLLKKSCEYFGNDILPYEIIQKHKYNNNDNIYLILQEFIANEYNKEFKTETFKPCIELEKKYYKNIFNLKFPNCKTLT